MTVTFSVQELKQRLGPTDEKLISLTLSVPIEQRLRTMLDMQNIVLLQWHDRMRKAYPYLTDMERTRLVFRRIRQNG